MPLSTFLRRGTTEISYIAEVAFYKGLHTVQARFSKSDMTWWVIWMPRWALTTESSVLWWGSMVLATVITTKPRHRGHNLRARRLPHAHFQLVSTDLQRTFDHIEHISIRSIFRSWHWPRHPSLTAVSPTQMSSAVRKLSCCATTARFIFMSRL